MQTEPLFRGLWISGQTLGDRAGQEATIDIVVGILGVLLILEATRLWNQGDTKANPISFREGSFWYQRGRTVYNIGDADRSTNTLRGVRIYELSDRGRLLRSIEAERAHVDDEERWVFEAPIVRSFDPLQAEQPPVTTHHEGNVGLDLEGGSAVVLMNADVTTLSVGELREVIERQRRSGREPSRTQALLHSRLAEPFAVLLFVVAAIPLGARVERSGAQGMTVPALYGIAIVATFFSVRSVADTLTAGGLLPASPIPWLLLAVFFGFSAWRYVEMPA